MTQQLTLVAPTSSWRIDDETREIGLRGVAAARATLESARRRQLDADAVGRSRLISSGTSHRFVAALAVLLGLSTACESPARPASSSSNAIVTGVVDGDTIDVSVDGTIERVRLLGIDAPESVDRQRPEQCFGKAAATHLATLLPPGSPVLLVRDLDPRDRYGRLLAYVFTPDDHSFINEQLVAGGFADVLIYEPNTAYATTLRTARRRAQADRQGLWAACDGPDQPVQPTTVRHPAAPTTTAA